MSVNNKSGYQVVSVFEGTISDRQAEEEIIGLLKEQYLRKLMTGSLSSKPLQPSAAKKKREHTYE